MCSRGILLISILEERRVPGKKGKGRGEGVGMSFFFLPISYFLFCFVLFCFYLHSGQHQQRNSFGLQ